MITSIMELDTKLIKAILKYVEKNDDGTGRPMAVPELPGYSSTEVTYHVNLCSQAGYVTTQETSAEPYLRSLTWQGHQELARLRSCCP